MHMGGGISDPLSRCVNKSNKNVFGTTLLVTGSHLINY